jgi:hypothetical protein
MNIIEIHYETKEGTSEYFLASHEVILKDFHGNYEDYVKKSLVDEPDVGITQIKPYKKEPVEPKRFSDGTILIGVITKKEQERFLQERRAKLRKTIEVLTKWEEENKERDQSR